MRRRQRTTRYGFLLIEVLLVVVILSVSLTVIISSMMTCLRGVSYIRDYTQAAWLLDNKIAQLMTFSEGADDDQGPFEEPYEHFRYALKERDPLADQARELDKLKAVTVEIGWTAGGKEKKVLSELWVTEP